MKNILFELWGEELHESRSSQLYIDATFAIAKRKTEKNSGLYRIRTLDLCDTGAVLLQIELQANWEQIVICELWDELESYESRSSQL